MQETWVLSLGWEDPLKEGMATHSSILIWRVPRTEEPGGLQSIASQSQAQLSVHAQRSFPPNPVFVISTLIIQMQILRESLPRLSSLDPIIDNLPCALFSVS